MVPTNTSLLALPPELLIIVSDYLPLDGILALKLTHRLLNATLPLPRNRDMSNCAYLAIRTYLSRPEQSSSHRRCILCKKLYPISIFQSSNSPACLLIAPRGVSQQLDVVELPQRLCSWHIGRLARVIDTGTEGRNEWSTQMDDMCIHCGGIQRWAKCDCDCSTCAFRSVRTYTRYLNNQTECQRFVFWRDRATMQAVRTLQEDIREDLMVRETCWDPDSPTQKRVIDLPIPLDDLSLATVDAFPARGRRAYQSVLSPSATS
ncbi:hypothetical protein GQ44DRAFT_716539 [Phaeosphaeriaceae sp. PMI808]|nr:hypothetical protein GQ44DRAFT_716539 [Phaeosphaeriaceae sp. PMI808]